MATASADVQAESLGVWDVRDLPRWESWMGEANAWAQQHIADANHTYRVEFYLAGAPFGVIYRYVADGNGRVKTDPVTGSAMCAEPVTEMLGELPPAHLLTRRV